MVSMLEMTELAVYKIVFVIEILLMMFLFSIKIRKRNHYLIRAIIFILVSLVAAIVFPIQWEFCYTWWYSTLLFFVLFLICSLGLFFICDASWQKIFLISILSYTIQHFAHEVYSLLVHIFNLIDNPYIGIYGDELFSLNLKDITVVLCLCIYLLSYILIYNFAFLILRKRVDSEDVKINNISIILISGLILFTDILFNSVVIYNSGGYDFTNTIIVCAYNILCCVMIIYIQLSVVKTKIIEKELQTTSYLLHQAEERFNESKQNIDLINIKCHDMKHQIREYGGKGKIPEENIKEIENIINVYDSEVKTGNKVLDLIFTQKSLLCQKKNIKLTCLADCTRLDFISEVDLYSLFGNAIDNAIEAVVKIKDPEKRSINLIVRCVCDCLSITLENYYEGKIILDNQGLPITTKENKDYHGYGIKSIQYLVDKYNGTLNISINEDVFSLYILFVLN